MPIQSINPATGEVLRRFEAHDEAFVEAALERSAAAFRSWRPVPFAGRAPLMARAAEILEADKRRFAETMTLEMGKPIGAALAEAEKCAWVCRFYAENAERFLAPEAVATDASRSSWRATSDS